MANENKQNQIQIEVPADEMQGKYANLAVITHGPNDFFIDVEIMGDGVIGNRENVRLGDICARAECILRRGKKRINPYSRPMLLLFSLWYKLLPLRPYLLYAYRLLPWNYFWVRRQIRAASSKG